MYCTRRTLHTLVRSTLLSCAVLCCILYCVVLYSALTYTQQSKHSSGRLPKQQKQQYKKAFQNTVYSTVAASQVQLCETEEVARLLTQQSLQQITIKYRTTTYTTTQQKHGTHSMVVCMDIFCCFCCFMLLCGVGTLWFMTQKAI